VQTQTQCQHTLFSYAYFISSFVYNSYNLHVDIDLRDYVFVLVCMLIYTCTLLCLSVCLSSSSSIYWLKKYHPISTNTCLFYCLLCFLSFYYIAA